MTSPICRPRVSVRRPATVVTDGVAKAGTAMTVRSCDSCPSIVSRGSVGTTVGGVGAASCARTGAAVSSRSEEHTSELQSLMRISYAVFCLKKKKHKHKHDETRD